MLDDELSLPLEGWVEFNKIDNDNNDNGDDDGDDGSGKQRNNNNHNEEELLSQENTRRQLEIRDRLIHRARSIGSIASRHFYEEEPTAGIYAIHKLKDMAKIVKEAGLTAEEVGMPWERIVRGAALCESKRRDGKWDSSSNSSGGSSGGGSDDGENGSGSGSGSVDGEESVSEWPCNSKLGTLYSFMPLLDWCLSLIFISFPAQFNILSFNICKQLVVYSVLDGMSVFPSDNKDATFEALSNALVRRTVFVTGAVDMKGCPPEDRGEVAFIGRSNVGKSSLVNMVSSGC